MPKSKTTTAEGATKVTRRSTTRTSHGRAHPEPDDTCKPAARKPRAPRVKAATSEVVVSESDETLRSRHTELLESVAAAEKRLNELRREAATACETFDEASRLMATARADAAAIRRTVAEAQSTARTAREEARAALTVAESTQQELDLIEDRIRTARGSRAVVAEAGLTDSNGSAESRAALAAPVVTLPVDLPDVETIPASERAGDAQDRLIRYLNDARAVEHEQAGLLQNLIDATSDAELRLELDQHRTISQEQERAIEARIKALGAEPSGGRGLLGLIVSRVWEVMQKPRDGADDAVETALKALGVAELEAGMYLAVHALARALEDQETADLAARHLTDERDFANRLRLRIGPTAARAARMGEPVA